MIKSGHIEYKMPKEFAKEILRIYGKKGQNPQEVLTKYVNEYCGLIYNCERVILF